MKEFSPKLEKESPPEDNSSLQLLDEFWTKERKPGEPEVKFKIAFGNHSKSEDIEFFRKDFEASDIYIPENISWSPKLQENWNKLSSGQLTTDEFIDNLRRENPNRKTGPYELAIIKMVEKSGKFISYVDVPDKYEPIEKLMPILSTWQIKLREALTLNDKIAVMKENLPILAESVKLREDFMFQQIPEAIREALEKKPELKQKKEIKVLLSLGAGHTPLFMKIQSISPNSTERFFSKMPFVFDRFATLIRKSLLMGEGAVITDEEIAEAILELEKGV